MNNTTNALNWFEIPAIDLNRSQKFYETIFNVKMMSAEIGDMKMAMFPMDLNSGNAGGGIAQTPNHKPSKEGTVVYLNANPAMDNVISKVEEAGGEILLPKTPIGENGFMALVMDTEGNTVGIHSTE